MYDHMTPLHFVVLLFSTSTDRLAKCDPSTSA